MSRFFVDPASVGENTIIIDGDDVKHITKVLRLREGDEIDVSDSKEWEYSCEIVSISDDMIGARILNKQKFSREPELKVNLFQGVPKGSKMEMIVQKATELGVSEIVPVFMIRSVVVDNVRYGKKIIRYNSIANEAAKQCGRGIVPIVQEAIHSDDMPNIVEEFDLILFPYEKEKELTIKDALRNLEKKPKSIAIIIGPEGGFSEEEARLLIFAGAVSVSLGKTILRTETAGLATIAMCMYELEM